MRLKPQRPSDGSILPTHFADCSFSSRIRSSSLKTTRLLLLLMLVGILTISLAVLLPTKAIGAPSPPRPLKTTVFLPLQIISPEQGDELAALVDKIMLNLELEPAISLLSREQLQQLLTYPAPWPPSPATLKALPLPAATRFLVVGSLTQLGAQFSIDVMVLDLETKVDPSHFSALAGNQGQLAPVLTQLLGEIMLHIEPAMKISSVHIAGNNKIGAGAILHQVGSRAGERLNPERLREDMRSIFAMGFFDDVKIETEIEAEGTKVTFVVTEKAIIGQVIISGNRHVRERDIREILAVTPHTIINTRLVHQAAINIRSLYEERGYRDTEVSTEIIETAPGTVNVHFKIEEGQRVHVRVIKFTGNENFSPRVLRRIVHTNTRGIFSWITQSGRFQPELLEHDRSRIVAFYHSQGFIDARVGEPEIIQEDDRLTIIFNIEEGARFTVGELSLTGELIAPTEELMALIKLNRERYFNRDILQADITRLVDRYAQEGYAFAEVIPIISRDDELKRMNVVFELTKNFLVHINRITIHGNTRTRDNVIRREVMVREGGIFDTSAIRASMQNLRRLNFFEEVGIHPEPALGRDDLMDVQIEVKEQPTGTFSIGGGYSSVDQFMFMSQIRQDNLMGRGQSLALDVSLSAKATHYNLSFTEPRLDDSHLLFGFDLYNWEREFIDYTKQSTGGGLRFAYPIWEKWQAYWGYSYEVNRLSDIGPTPSRWILQSQALRSNSFVRLGVVRDTLDHRLAPTRGSLHDINIRHAGGWLGGDTAYTRLMASTTWFFPWDEIPMLKETDSKWLRATTFRLKGSAGYIRENEAGRLPIYEKFSLGGLRTVRGFEAASISPIDPVTRERIGGEKMWYMNSEWIFPLLPDIGLKGLLFFDAGQVYAKPETWGLDNLRKSVGFGFRWLSPLGPLRLEWGHNLDPKPDEKATVWDFSIGGVF